MKKGKIIGEVKNWFIQSNRYKHLAGGFIIGLFATNLWTAVYAGAIAGAALEFKDKSYGGEWDWIDLGLTFAGALMGGCIVSLL